jgi:predicted RNA-binding protein with PIN domain
MQWVLDGYNVIRRDPELRAREAESLPAGRQALLALLARLAQRTSEHFVVVFDGERRTPGPPGSGRVQVVFARPPESADDELRRRGAALGQGGVVVSSDRAVQTAVRRAGGIAVGAEEFLAVATGVGLGPADDDDDDAAPRRGGPARRPSREERTAARVLRRLQPR